MPDNMPNKNEFDLIVIGGGPGGYVGAIRAAQLGLSVACVEAAELGGVCLNWGCIPTKALLASAELFRAVKLDAQAWGIEVDGVSHNWQQVIARSRTVAGNLNKGIGFLFKKNQITHVPGRAFIPQPGVVEVYDHNAAGPEGTPIKSLRAKNILVATGAKPRSLPGEDCQFDGEKIIGSKEAMSLPQQPQKLLIVGAGAIGMEFAYFFNAFGTQVTVVEMLDRLLPIEDADVSKAIAKAYRKLKITTMTATKTLSITKTTGGIEAVVAPVDDESKTTTIQADKVLVAVGVSGNCAQLFDRSLGIEIFKDHIKVDKSNYQTGVAGIYAVGDVIGPPWLAHVASEEAVVCVEKIAGHNPEPINYQQIPGCTYCQPQVASVGLTQQKCKEQGLDIKTAQFPFQASGKAQAMGHTAGFVKLISDKHSGEILGAHMIGENVTELIAQIVLAMKAEVTPQEIITTIHAHPTLSEAIHEAALGLDGRMIHS